MQNEICNKCRYDINYENTDIEYNKIVCPLCNNHIYINRKQVFYIGDVVKIINKEHIWNEEYAIIRDTKSGFSRIELNSELSWVPNHWIKQDEPNDTDK